MKKLTFLLFFALFPLSALADNEAFDGGDHDWEVMVEQLEGQEEGTLTLELKPKAPLAWNEEYPSRLTLESKAPLHLEKTQFQGLKKEISVKDGRALLKTKWKAKSGSYPLELKGKFSICDDRRCLMKTADFPFTLKVN